MTNQRMIAEVFRIQNAITGEDYKTAQDLCADLVRVLTDDINTAAAKKSGKKDAQAAALRILKKGAAGSHPCLAKANTAKDGAQLLCDGYRMIKLPNPLPLPVLTSDEYEDAREIIPRLENYLERAAANAGVWMNAPTVASLKTFIATERAAAAVEHRRLDSARFEIVPGMWVDALLLVDLLQVLDTPTMTFARGDRWNLQPIYLKGKNGAGLLLPMRPIAG